MDLRGQRALVTGASSGLGVCFAKQLAAAGANLVITARREDRLQALAEELRRDRGVEVLVVPLDLARPGAPAELLQATEGAGLPVDVLINNAGFGTRDPFAEIPWQTTADQLQLNMVALTELTHLFLAQMRSRNRGHILNVASVGAYQPVPYYATYAATKAYVRNFTEALASELAGSPVRVCCLCPGPTATEFMDVAGHELGPLERAFVMSADRCVRIGLAALFRGRRNIISGWLNSFTYWLIRFVPRRVVVGAAGLIMRPRG